MCHTCTTRKPRGFPKEGKKQKMATKFSLTEFASDKTRMAFMCECKECGFKLTKYVPVATWLDIAFVLVQDDLLTQAEYKTLHHLAASQWATIEATLAKVA